MTLLIQGTSLVFEANRLDAVSV